MTPPPPTHRPTTTGLPREPQPRPTPARPTPPTEAPTHRPTATSLPREPQPRPAPARPTAPAEAPGRRPTATAHPAERGPRSGRSPSPAPAGHRSGAAFPAAAPHRPDGGGFPGSQSPLRPGPAPATPPGRAVPAGGDGPLRVTWVQPEDLIGHELRQAAEDGRDAEAVRRTWAAAGGHPAPGRAGASPGPASAELRALASRLLDELARLPSPLAPDEPTSWQSIRATRPAPDPDSDSAPGSARGRVGAGAPPQGAERRTASLSDPEATFGARGGAPAHARPRAEADPGPGPGHGVPRRPGDGVPRTAAPAAHPAPLQTRLEAAWLGRAAGCLLGKPVEKLPLDGIRALARAAGNWPLDDWFTERGVPPEVLAAHPWNRRSAPTSLAENIDGMPEDDDLNYPLLGLLLLQRHGKGFTTADVGRLWLDELPAGRTFTAERVAYRNLLHGLEPPLTATHHNPFREWIGALIRADVHGWTNPGDPAAAAAQAHRDAVLTHTANGVYAALFVAAATAEAAGGRADVHTALRAGLAVVPPRSRLAEAVRHGIAAAEREADFDRVVDRLHARYGHHHWVHALPNTALLAAALTHADGDFTGSICRAVSGGWDTDSNGATAGALAGILAGSPRNLPHRWTAPLNNRLSTSVPGFDGIGFDALARLTHHLAAQEAPHS
ncbi:ADP-ribosylglycohydrolase family protein [Streptomyces sp. NPDC088762]|uniref:ADP-ribosylglycohydrolase family protein n=1 Tax=Streptomyces sp. NPDC088762 TaxID=3365891 RepID=UPI0037FEC47F